jgi:hypothetical protein
MKPAPDPNGTSLRARERQSKDAIRASQQALREVEQALGQEDLEAAERLLTEAERLNATVRAVLGLEKVR